MNFVPLRQNTNNMKRNLTFKFDFEPYFECYRWLTPEMKSELTDAFQQITSNISSNKDFTLYLNQNNSTQDIRKLFDEILYNEISDFIDFSDDVHGLYIFNMLTSEDEWKDVMFSQFMFPLVEEKLQIKKS